MNATDNSTKRLYHHYIERPTEPKPDTLTAFGKKYGGNLSLTFCLLALYLVWCYARWGMSRDINPVIKGLIYIGAPLGLLAVPYLFKKPYFAIGLTAVMGLLVLIQAMLMWITY